MQLKIFGKLNLLLCFVLLLFFSCDSMREPAKRAAEPEKTREKVDSEVQKSKLEISEKLPVSGIPFNEGEELRQMRNLDDLKLKIPPRLKPEKIKTDKVIKLFRGLPAQNSEVSSYKTELILDGDRISKGSGWANANDKKNGADAAIKLKSGAGVDGSNCLSFKSSGEKWKGGGWNFADFYDPDKTKCIDASDFKSIAFDVKINGEMKDYDAITFAVASSDQQESQWINPKQAAYIDGWSNDRFQKIVIPFDDFKLDRGKDLDISSLWEFRIGYWGQGEVEVLIDNIYLTEKTPSDPRYLNYPRQASYNVSIEVNTDKKLHSISELIYGIANATDQMVNECNISSLRLGGNQASPYNWKKGCSNQGADWFHRNVKDMSDKPGWIKNHKSRGIETFITIPMLSRLASDDDNSKCAFPKTEYPPQSAYNPNDPNQGNGKPASGDSRDLLLGRTKEEFSVPNSPEYQSEFVEKVKSLNVGQIWYIMDNEPMLWFHTHAGIEPEPLTYESYWKRFAEYTEAVLSADKSSKIAGPCLWGWNAYNFCAADTVEIIPEKKWISERKVLVNGKEKPWYFKPPFRLKHDNIPFFEWFLAKCAEYEKKHGKRLLHALDIHYYPQRWVDGAGTVYDPRNRSRNAEYINTRIQSTRTLWDKDYKKNTPPGKTWINDTVCLIPRMKNAIERIYPGTDLALNEYGWAGQFNISGALAQAELLGIFAWLNLDIAHKWGAPNGSQKLAFKLFRNYDGNKNTFGNKFLLCGSSDFYNLSVFAAEDLRNQKITVLLINKNLNTPANTALKINGVSREKLDVYTVSEYNLEKIMHKNIQWKKNVGIQIPPLTAALFVFDKL